MNLLLEKKKEQHNKKQNIISACILVGGTILSLLIFGPDKSISQEPTPEEVATVVETTILIPGEENVAVLYKTAQLNSTNSSNVTAESSGRVQNVDFEVGEYVEKDQILATFNQSRNESPTRVALDSAYQSYNYALENLEKTKRINRENQELAKNARKIAEIQLDQAKDSGDDNAEDLAKRNLENAEDLEDQAEQASELQLLGAQQQVNQASAGLEQAKISHENTAIKTPVSGFVVSKNISNDQQVNFGEVVAEIVGSGNLETSVALNENQIGRVKIGDDVKIIFSDQEATGKITALSSIANPTSNRFDVTIQSDGELSEQSHKTAKIEMKLRATPNNPGSFFVPLSAVNIGQQTNTVFIKKNGHAMLIEVELGESIGDQIEVTKGLRENDYLITGNNRGLQDGELVTSDQTADASK